MVEFCPSNPKVPGSTPAYTSFFLFFWFCLQNFKFCKFSYSKDILEAKQTFPSLFEHQKVSQMWYVPLVLTGIWTRDLSHQSPTPYPLGHEGNELIGLKTFERVLICFPFDHPSLRQIGLKPSLWHKDSKSVFKVDIDWWEWGFYKPLTLQTDKQTDRASLICFYSTAEKKKEILIFSTLITQIQPKIDNPNQTVLSSPLTLLQWCAIETRHLLERKEVCLILNILEKYFWNKWYHIWKP